MVMCSSSVSSERCREMIVRFFSIAVAVIILLVDLWAIVSVFRSNKSVGVKAAWAIGLIVFPVLGLIVYFAYARRRSHLAPGNEHLLHAHTHDPKLEPNPILQQGPDAGP